MNTVYILVFGQPWVYEIVGIFTNKEKAEKEMEECIKCDLEYDPKGDEEFIRKDYSIEEWEVK